MNYTKTIREFCLKNRGEIFDASKMAEDYFAMVSYKTLLKILNRLTDEGLLTPVSKGVYQITTENGIDQDAAMKKMYVDYGRGMYVGYKMYNAHGVSDHNYNCIEIYTNGITTKHKTIGKYKLTRVDLFFSRDTEMLVRALELIENLNNIKGLYHAPYVQERKRSIEYYSDEIFEKIIKEIHYQYSTIVTLDMRVKEYTDKPCNCLEIYKKHTLEK